MMIRGKIWAFVLTLGTASTGLAQQQGPPPRVIGDAPAKAPAAKPAAPAPAKAKTVEELARAIDRHLEAHWAANKVTPAPMADDAEFNRRLYLDVLGAIPAIGDTRTLLEDKDPARRERKIKELFNRPGFLSHYSTVLRQTWIPQATDNIQFSFLMPQFETWIQKKLRANTPTDQIVRELLTAPTLFNGRNRFEGDPQDTPMAFNQVNEFKPENVASVASRLFMGVKIECAQCHNHPFAPYKKEQFWELAAFFADIQPTIANIGDVKVKREIKIPDTTKVVQAKFFDGKNPKWDDAKSPRQTFADWLTSKDNPYFARNFANRLWAHFFGLGLIDPIDEPSDENPPAIPALLEELTRAFIDSGYDQKYLMGAIVRSKAYQLTSRQTHPSQADPRHFARMTIKGLTGEQFFDSLAMATGYNDPTPREQRVFSGDRRNFINKFSTTEKITEKQKSILQALTMMNGRFLTDQTSLNKSVFLDGIVQSPFWGNKEKVEMLFLASLSRFPTPHEAERFASYVDRGGVSNDSKKALGDVFWALLNSSEFGLNH